MNRVSSCSGLLRRNLGLLEKFQPYEETAGGFAIELIVADFIVIDCDRTSTGDWRLRVQQGLAFVLFDPYPARPLTFLESGIRIIGFQNSF